MKLHMSPPDVHMRWDNLLFLHWPIEPAVMRAAVPSELEIDTFDGKAWIALVPFRMEETRFRGVPNVLGQSRLFGLSTFYECNVRTYVTARNTDGQQVPGVWFFSLDAERLLPVLGARWLWGLNYIHSRFNITKNDGTTDYTLTRRAHAEQHTHVRWHRGETLPQSTPGSLEHFLTERYWLFSKRFGKIMGGRIEHEPWPLRTATVEHLDDTLIRSAGFECDSEPLAMHSDSISVRGWNLVPMNRVQDVRT